MRAIGLMSGTSMDGIDAALLESDGANILAIGGAYSLAYSADERRLLEQALEDAKEIVKRDERPGCLLQAEAMVTDRHAAAVNALLLQEGLTAQDVDVIGFHGQTVLHRPNDALTVQIGDGAALAQATGITTVYDMRAQDMKAGGQGAPLVPIFHAALARNIAEKPVAFVNIGGISNITFVGENGELEAFDVGPGNALIDQWVQAGAGVPYDQGGTLALEGGVSASVVARYMAAPFFAQKPPKSLDRFDFPALEEGALDLHDGARTLAHITAKAIYRSVEHVEKPPKLWLLCGGGRLNTAIVDDLRKLAGETDGKVALCDDYGFNGDMMEAQAFAHLAVRSLNNLPLTFPSTTGCKDASCGGVLVHP